MITTIQFASMARAAYGLREGKGAPAEGGFGPDPNMFDFGTSWGFTETRDKGCVFVRRGTKEFVIAFEGTVPGKFLVGPGAKHGDFVCDIQLAVGMLIGLLPGYCGDALRLLNKAQAAYPGYRPYLVGHSLGGAVAQVIGQWSGIPFVTFNAPGVWSDIQISKLPLLPFPEDTLNSIAGTFKGSLLAKQRASTGRNFRNILDPVSTFGSHYGPVTRLWKSGGHSMDSVYDNIKSSDWCDIDPLDPKNKEWGELD